MRTCEYYPIAITNGENENIYLESDYAAHDHETMQASDYVVDIGPGAGEGPTASAVMSDIIDISGGLETSGVKDKSKIDIFLNKVEQVQNET